MLPSYLMLFPLKMHAAISMVGMTAWHMLVDRAKIKPGQTVFIMGGTSGVGMAGIQIAKLYNCDVIATAGNQEKMDTCLKLGADQVVNHREADWSKKVRNLTNKQGVDVVFEHIGKSVFPQEVSLLKMGGTLVATGATTGYDSTIDLRYLFFKGTNLLGSTQGTKSGLENVIYWTGKGKIKPLIATKLPFSEMVKGHTMMANAEQIGKILTNSPRTINFFSFILLLLFNCDSLMMFRTLLFIPGNNKKFLDKSKFIYPDILCFDIEDSSTYFRKINS